MTSMTMSIGTKTSMDYLKTNKTVSVLISFGLFPTYLYSWGTVVCESH